MIKRVFHGLMRLLAHRLSTQVFAGKEKYSTYTIMPGRLLQEINLN